MYYMVTGRHKSEGQNGITFEYVADVDTIDRIYDIADDEDEEVISIREMTIPELIEREKRELMGTVARTYVFARHKDADFDTRIQKLKEFDMESEDFFLALKSFNERQRYLRRLMHRKKKGKIDLEEFLKIMNGLIDCTEEEDVDNLIKKMEDEIE